MVLKLFFPKPYTQIQKKKNDFTAKYLSTLLEITYEKPCITF